MALLVTTDLFIEKFFDVYTTIGKYIYGFRDTEKGLKLKLYTKVQSICLLYGHCRTFVVYMGIENKYQLVYMCIICRWTMTRTFVPVLWIIGRLKVGEGHGPTK